MTDIASASEALRRGRRSMRLRFCCASCAALAIELVLAASVVAYAVVFLRGDPLGAAGVLLARFPVFVRPVLLFGAAMLPCARVSDVSKLAGPIAPAGGAAAPPSLSTRKTARAMSYHRALGVWMVVGLVYVVLVLPAVTVVDVVRFFSDGRLRTSEALVLLLALNPAIGLEYVASVRIVHGCGVRSNVFRNIGAAAAAARRRARRGADATSANMV